MTKEVINPDEEVNRKQEFNGLQKLRRHTRQDRSCVITSRLLHFVIEEVPCEMLQVRVWLSTKQRIVSNLSAHSEERNYKKRVQFIYEARKTKNKVEKKQNKETLWASSLRAGNTNYEQDGFRRFEDAAISNLTSARVALKAMTQLMLVLLVKFEPQCGQRERVVFEAVVRRSRPFRGEPSETGCLQLCYFRL